jgi:hypothetical protein
MIRAFNDGPNPPGQVSLPRTCALCRIAPRIPPPFSRERARRRPCVSLRTSPLPCCTINLTQDNDSIALGDEVIDLVENHLPIACELFQIASYFALCGSRRGECHLGRTFGEGAKLRVICGPSSTGSQCLSGPPIPPQCPPRATPAAQAKRSSWCLQTISEPSSVGRAATSRARKRTRDSRNTRSILALGDAPAAVSRTSAEAAT